MANEGDSQSGSSAAASPPPETDAGSDQTHVRASQGDPQADSEKTHLRPLTPGEESGLQVPALGLPTVAEEHYAVGDEVARGGLGKILRARDRRLGRDVALKVLRVRKPDAEARFLREALVTARLQHPAIVPIYEAGVWPDGEPFYAMKLLSGKPLSDLIKERPTLPERLALLPNVIAAADAIAYAHDKRIIHRDLKPHNVMVGDFGETVVIDWGLAKDLDARAPDAGGGTGAPASDSQSSSGETMAGSVLGTPAYMPPEQARGERVDQRADVYSLGAMLYHLLRGEMPFAELRSPAEALRRVMLGPPPALEQVMQGVPADLAAIVKKAMEARVEDRYPSARELALDLRRFQTGQLVSVRQYSTWEVTSRWLRRRAAVVGVAAAALFVLGAGGVVAVEQVIDERNVAQARRLEAEAARRQADEARAQSEADREVMVLAQARSSLERDPTAALAWLQRHSGGPELARLRTLASDAASRGVASHVFRRHGQPVRGLAFGASKDALWSAGEDGRLVRYDLSSGEAAVVREPPGILWQLARPAGGAALAVGDGTARVQLLSGSGAPRTFELEDPPLLTLAIAPDGSRLAAGTVKGRLFVWDVASGARRELAAHPSEVRDLAFSADGRTLASVSFDGTARLTALEGGAAVTLSAASGETYSLALAPDGRLLATPGANDSLRLYDAAAGKVLPLPEPAGRIVRLAFSPDGKTLAAACRDGAVRLWSAPWQSPRKLLGHTADVLRVAWSPDGRRLASSGADQSVRVWEPDTGEVQVLLGHTALVHQLAFSDDGARLASAGQDTSVRVWPLAPQGERLAGGHGQLLLSPRGTRRLAVDAQGALTGLTVPAALGARRWKGVQFLSEDQALAVDEQRTAVWWNLATGEHQVLGALDVDVGQAGLAAGHVAVGAYDGSLRTWPVGGGAERRLDAHKTYTLGVAASPDGALLATGGDEGGVKLWELGAGTQRLLHSHAGPVHHLRFSDDGRLLASGDIHGEVRVWDLREGRAVFEDRHQGWARALAFSRDGSLFASSGDDKAIHVTRLEGRETRRLAGPEQSVVDLMFSPDGALVAAASLEPAVRVFERSSGSARVLRVPGARASRVQFTPDGAALDALDGRGGLWRWPRAAFAPLPPGREGLDAFIRAATTARLDRQLQPTTAGVTP